MVLCFVALIVFGVLGIFSAKYRKLAKESFDCVLRTATLRPCQSGLDERMQAAVVGSILPHSPATARAINKNFQALSVLFVILFFASLAYSAVSVYNYWAYGNCNGPNSTAFCVFDALEGGHAVPLTAVAPGVGPNRGAGNSTLVEFGCFSCPYTREAQAPLNDFLSLHPEIKLEFRAFPIPTHENSNIAAQAAFCAQNQSRFWQYYDALFADSNHSRGNLVAIAGSIGLDAAQFGACLDSPWSAQRVQEDVDAGKKAGIYGTPTFFYGNYSLVGPTSVQDFEDLVAGRTANQSAPVNGSCGPISR